MKFIVDLPEEVVARLRAYAGEQRQSPEEAISGLVSRDLVEAPTNLTVASEPPVGVNPLAEFFGRYTADEVDITRRHDHYLADEAEGKPRETIS